MDTTSVGDIQANLSKQSFPVVCAVLTVQGSTEAMFNDPNQLRDYLDQLRASRIQVVHAAAVSWHDVANKPRS